MSSPTEASAEHRFLIDLCLNHLVPFFWQSLGLLLISRSGLPLILADLNARDVEGPRAGRLRARRQRRSPTPRPDLRR
jgi:hypothetical protein